MKKLLLLFSAAGMLALASCSKSESPSAQSSGDAKVQLILTDAPADYKEVNVSIKEININVGDETNEKWVNYPLSAQLQKPVNLLTLRNGGTMYMGEPLALPAGKISQIRLVLNETGNTLVLNDGTVNTLTTPSGQTSGLKINFHQTLSPDGIYKIWLDFDAARSIVKAGNSSKYILKPVIKAMLESTSAGAISGFVKPAESKTTVYLKQGTDTIGVAIPETAGSSLGEGFFKFVNLKAGTYSLSLNADDATMYKDSTIASAIVTAGKITTLGTSTLHK